MYLYINLFFWVIVFVSVYGFIIKRKGKGRRGQARTLRLIPCTNGFAQIIDHLHDCVLIVFCVTNPEGTPARNTI